MLLSAAELEEQYRQRVFAQAKAQEAQRFANPDRDPSLEDVWVVYVWSPVGSDPSVGEWILAGFRRRRNRRKPQTMNRFFSKVRRKLNIHKKSPVLLLDLDEATRRVRSADQSWRTRPPTFQPRKPKLIASPTPPILTKKGKKTKVRTRMAVFTKQTKFIVLGRNPWDRDPGYLYLGPLQSDRKRSAQFEAKRLFPIYKIRVIVGVDELSKPLRGAMLRRKRVRGGITRIAWPEVPPTFDSVWSKLLAKGKVDPIGSRQYEQVLDWWTQHGTAWPSRSQILKVVRDLTPRKPRIIWKDRVFVCTQCDGHGDTPASIMHESDLCVPITLQENTECARTAKVIARRHADKLRKRRTRRKEQKVAAEKERVTRRKRAAKKAARTRQRNRAKVAASPKSIRKTTPAKRSPRSGRSVGKSGMRSASLASSTHTKIGTLRIVAILRNAIHGRRN